VKRAPKSKTVLTGTSVGLRSDNSLEPRPNPKA
jgi:hypothetical protein